MEGGIKQLGLGESLETSTLEVHCMYSGSNLLTHNHSSKSGCPLSFETGDTMGYNCCFFLNFVPLHIESPYNFGGTGPILGVKNPLQRVNGHAENMKELGLAFEL